MIAYTICGIVLIGLIAVIANKVTKIKMLEEECAAMREQLYESNPDTAGYGIAAMKPKIHDAPFEGKISREEAKRAARKARGINEK